MLSRFAAIAAAFLAAPAFATVAGLPDAVFLEEFQTSAGSQLFDQPSAYASGVETLYGEYAFVDATDATAPSVRATVQNPSSSTGFIAAESQINYFIDIAGPASGVKVDVTALGQGFVGAGGEIGGLVSIAQGPSACFGTAFNDDLNHCTGTSLSLDETVTLPTNTLLKVTVEAFASATYQPTVFGASPYATAYVDPTFTISSAQADAGAYAILYSPNMAAVPEPASASLLLAGLAAMLGARRARVKAA